MDDILLYIYQLQQNTTNLLAEQLNHITWLSFSCIFLGGILTSLSPCTITSLTVSISYINKQAYRQLHIAILIFGILTSIITIGLSSLLLKNSYGFLGNLNMIIYPIILISLGLSLLNIIEFNFYIPQNIEENRFAIRPVIQTYIIGYTIGVNISPCSTPLLMIIITWISTTRNILIGFLLLLIYSIGYICPILFSIISTKNLQKITLFKSTWNHIIPYSGSLIIAIGTFSLYHQILLKLKL